MSMDSDDEMSGTGVAVFLILLCLCVYGIYWGVSSMRLENSKFNCQGIYDTLQCRVNMQIKEDTQAQIDVLQRRINEVKKEQLEVNYE